MKSLLVFLVVLELLLGLFLIGGTSVESKAAKLAYKSYIEHPNDSAKAEWEKESAKIRQADNIIFLASVFILAVNSGGIILILKKMKAATSHRHK
jgi:hypothetical protein